MTEGPSGNRPPRTILAAGIAGEAGLLLAMAASLRGQADEIEAAALRLLDDARALRRAPEADPRAANDR